MKHGVYSAAHANTRRPPNFAALSFADLQRMQAALLVELLYWQVYLLREWLHEIS